MTASKPTYFDLFWSFFKIGFFTFGGGLAMIPFIVSEFVDKKKWISADDMNDIIALSQSFPGVVAINSSILVGFRVSGFVGAIFAAVGTILPALISIVAIVSVLQGFEENRYVQMVFTGIKAASAALILDTVVRLTRTAIRDNFGWVVGGIALIIILFDISAAWSVVVGAVAGLVYYRKRRDAK